MEDFVKEFNFNVFSPVAMTQACMPHLEKTKGNIIFMSSINGKTFVPRTGTYCASKACIDMLAKIIALEEAPNGVRCNLVSPGPVATELLWNLPGTEGKTLDDIAGMLSKGMPVGRIGKTEEIARLCFFLASDEQGYITGADVIIDGATSLQSYVHKSD